MNRISILNNTFIHTSLALTGVVLVVVVRNSGSGAP
jgi:hypothetical protein